MCVSSTWRAARSIKVPASARRVSPSSLARVRSAVFYPKSLAEPSSFRLSSIAASRSIFPSGGRGLRSTDQLQSWHADGAALLVRPSAAVRSRPKTRMPEVAVTSWISTWSKAPTNE
jgi:hypothetical protein